MFKKISYKKIYFFYDFLVLGILFIIIILLVDFLHHNFYQIIIKNQSLPELSRGVVRTDIDLEKLEIIRENIERKEKARGLNAKLNF